MSGKKQFFEFQPLITFDVSGLTSSFQSAGTAWENDSVMVAVYNNSNTLVIITNDKDASPERSVPVPSQGTFVFDVQANAQNYWGAMRKNQGWFVKGSAGTGDLYIFGIGFAQVA